MKTKLMVIWRIIVALGMLCIISFAILLCCSLYNEHCTEYAWTEESEYSDLYEYEYTSNSLRLKEIRTDKYLTPKLSRIYTDDLKDSVTVFFQDGKRGFLNIYTGKIIVPAQFDRAWLFSEGLGAVVKNERLGFINSKGETVIPFQFNYPNKRKAQVDFLFKSGYCVVLDPVTDKYGLINKKGEWVVLPQYDYIRNPQQGLRMVRIGEKCGMMDSTFHLILPIEYDCIEYVAGGLLLQREYEKQLVDYDCKTIIQPFVYDYITYLTYETENLDKDGYKICAKSNMNDYEVDGRHGLMDENGKVVTKPLYTAIEALSKDLFVCNLDLGVKVTVNRKGEIVKWRAKD